MVRWISHLHLIRTGRNQFQLYTQMISFNNCVFFFFLFSIICPEDDGSSKLPVTLWSIMSKVRLEAMMWGAGTALGELPPYFMARAARLSSIGSSNGKRERRRSSVDLDDDIEQLAALKLKQQNMEKMVSTFILLIIF